jgi:hypothetical protein
MQAMQKTTNSLGGSAAPSRVLLMMKSAMVDVFVEE